MSGGGSSGGGGTSTTVQKNEPWDAAKPYYEQLYKDASAAYKNVDTSKYTGDLVASPSAATQSAQQKMLSYLPTLETAGQTALQNVTDTASGKYLDAANNDYLQGAIKVANDDLVKQFQQSIMPTIQSNAIQQGAYGGDRNTVAKTMATDDLTQNMSDTAAKIAYQNYATERGYQQNVPALLQQAMASVTAPASVESQVGAAMDAQTQAELDAELARYNANALSSLRGLDTLSNILGAGGFSSGTGTITSTPQNSGLNILGGVSGGLSGALGGAALGSVVPGIGPGVGALVGGLSGLTGGLF